MSNLFLAIERAASGRPGAVAFEAPGRTPVTFAELLLLVAQRAGALSRLGLEPGDRVAVQVEKSLENVWLYLATLRLGAVYVPLNTAYTATEIDYFVADARPSLVVVEPDRAPDLARANASSTRVVTLNEVAETPATDTTPVTPRAGTDLAAIVYTSGTTGRSKGAMLSHDNLASNATTLVDCWGFSERDVLVHALPIYHVHGLFVALHCALFSGACTRFLPRFDVAAVTAALRGATVFMGVPTYYTRLLQNRDFPLPGTDLRLWISGSAPLLTETFAQFEQRTGQRILERYGMSEAGMITSNPLCGDRVAGTVGTALPGVELRVRGTDGCLASDGQPGILEIKGPNVCSGYWQNEEKTRASFTSDGYFVTGDIVVRSATGIVTIVGREKDLIISGGLNVYPKEIETELDLEPGVRESAVIGLPHPDFGEAVVAIVDGDGASASETALIESLKVKLAGFKIPKRVLFVEALPRNAMGKVQKNELRTRFADLFVGVRQR